jgi:D-sedoheptulose 7-phosphate isomerase
VNTTQNDQPENVLRRSLYRSISVKQKMIESAEFIQNFDRVAQAVLSAYTNGGKILIAGNGGSAADAQHMAAEFVSRLMFDRDPLPAEAL